MVYKQDLVVFVTKNEKDNLTQKFFNSLMKGIKNIYKWFKKPER